MIHYIDSGAPKNSQIVMLHGAACSHEVWLTQYDYLKNYHRIILIDLPGHNKSSGEGFDTIEKYVNALHNKFSEMNLTEFVLCGHSMGGAITQLFALKHPEVLKGVILCSTGARLRVTHQVFEAIENDFNTFIDMSVTFSIAQDTTNEVKEKFRRIIQKCKPAVAMNDFRACNNFDLMLEIQNIKLPVFIICGDNDLLTPLKYSEYLHKNIAGSKLEILKSTGHMVMLERYTEVNSLINSFLQKL